jgi:hypothetical protein
LEPYNSCDRWHAFVVKDEKHIVSWRSDVWIGGTGNSEFALGFSAFGGFEPAKSLALVEPMRHRWEAY